MAQQVQEGQLPLSCPPPAYYGSELLLALKFSHAWLVKDNISEIFLSFSFTFTFLVTYLDSFLNSVTDGTFWIS